MSQAVSLLGAFMLRYGVTGQKTDNNDKPSCLLNKIISKASLFIFSISKNKFKTYRLFSVCGYEPFISRCIKSLPPATLQLAI